MHPDSHHPYHSLPWLERLTVHVAGYDASLKSGDRRGAARARPDRANAGSIGAG